MSRNKIIPYRKDLKQLARKLRKNSTIAEILLWSELKNKQILGFQFHRQVPILDYIVDFYCHELQLVIEIDGSTHDFIEVGLNDESRQVRLEVEGVIFLRFDDLQVKQNMASVIDEIINWIEQNQ
ncbi:endonuclease domain-containing protein [Marinifilum flexuosum]|uniref:Very-short-patch-repair endonuclease n=1 Tax=Marinifilum flexuosum TaxID=1117708 RepID=A0A419X8R6_9BACT|nr:endonuclease domain-containing protein [Marinifilum flexuosum]RKE04095.1 very-short-patch-repair endonuclease [Marinifilum flexuosum]